MPRILAPTFLLLLAGLARAQIRQTPEFQESPKFQTNPNGRAIDGTSHVSAEREQINTELVSHLRNIPSHADGLRLIDNHMLAAAQQEFRGKGLRLGLAVTQFLLGQEEASAEGLCLLAESRPQDLSLAPFLGITSGSVPAYAGRMLALLRTTAAAHPSNGEAQFYLAQALLKQNPPRTAEAIPYLLRSVELEAKDTRALMELGRQYTELGQLPKAIAVLEQALARDEKLATAHYRIASLYRLTGKHVKSTEHLLKFQALQNVVH